MSDVRLRDAMRRVVATGSTDARAAAIVERLRANLITEWDVRAASTLGDPAALQVVPAFSSLAQTTWTQSYNEETRPLGWNVLYVDTYEGEEPFGATLGDLADPEEPPSSEHYKLKIYTNNQQDTIPEDTDARVRQLAFNGLHCAIAALSAVAFVNRSEIDKTLTPVNEAFRKAVNDHDATMLDWQVDDIPPSVVALIFETLGWKMKRGPGLAFWWGWPDEQSMLAAREAERRRVVDGFLLGIRPAS